MKIFLINNVLRCLALFVALIFCQRVLAQENTLKLVPEVPKASFGDRQFLLENGKVNLAFGDYTKSLKLFELKNNDISFPIGISYNSLGGVHVNDWGGRLGISWSAEFEVKISRQVNGKPDESGLGLKDESLAAMGAETTETYSKIQSVNKRGTSGQSIDGEYDVYNVSLNGTNLNFIIKQDTGILLNHTEGYIIKKVNSSDHDFLITDNMGTKYYFGGEFFETYKEFDSGFGATITGPIKIGWYLKKIESVKGDIISFFYSPTNYRSLVNVSDQADMCLEMDIDAYTWSPALQSDIKQTERNFGTPHTQPIFYTYSSCILERIECGNIKAIFSKMLRNDLNNEYVYSNVRLTYNNLLFKDFVLEYDNITSGDFTTPEKLRFDNLNYLSADSERAPLRNRYFLKNISEINPSQAPLKLFVFEYKNKGSLPPRYSYRQDLLGFPINRPNGSEFPENPLKKFKDEYNRRYPWFPMNYQLSDRSADTAFNDSGVLIKVENFFKGTEEILYETNKINRVEDIITYSNYNKSTQNETSPTEYWAGDSFNHKGGSLEIQVDLQYRLASLPPPESRDSYFINVGLYDVDNNIFLDLPALMKKSPNVDISPVFGKNYLYADLVNPRFSLKTELPVPVGNYELVVDILNSNLYSNIAVNYVSGITTKTVNNYYGIRVKEVHYQTGGTVPSAIKKQYIYNIPEFGQENSFVLTNKSSLVASADIDLVPRAFLGVYRSYKYYYPVHSETIPGTVSVVSLSYPLKYRTMVGESLFQNKLYSGRPYIYSHVVELVNNESFSGNLFFTDISVLGLQLFGADDEFYQYVYQSGWRTGMPYEANDGIKIGNNFTIKRKKTFEYQSNYLRSFRNYFSKTVEDETLDMGTILSQRINKFNLYVYNNFSIWHYLKRTKTTEYNTNGTVVQSEENFYNNLDKLISRNNIVDSRGEIITTNFSRVSSNINIPLYKKMYDKNILAPAIETLRLNNRNVTLSTQKNKYKEYSPNIFLLDSMQVFKGTNVISEESVIKAYSKTKFKPVEYKKNGEQWTVVLWGYGEEYPVLEIKNATYAEVTTALTQAAIDNMNNSNQTEATMETLIKNAADKLRTDLPKAMVTSYTYRPLVGMTSKTDARGIKETYTYDGMQRLQAILDHLNYVTKSFDYHYRPN
ncbi:hypothetical protein [Sphingobacterium multivorum]|uniref:hypothetical protein n=1 Tax=Sphingobacterium multivorum TaxID=28454 RepID=UPI00345E2495